MCCGFQSRSLRFPSLPWERIISLRPHQSQIDSSPQPGLVRILLLAAVTGVLTIIVSQADNCVRLNRGIRPILADDGFECYGPDKANCQADLGSINW